MFDIGSLLNLLGIKSIQVYRSLRNFHSLLWNMAFQSVSYDPFVGH